MPPRRRNIQQNNFEEDKEKNYPGYTKDFNEFKDLDIYIVKNGEIVEANEDQEDAFNDLQDGVELLDEDRENKEGQDLVSGALSQGMALVDSTVVYIDKADNKEYLVLAKLPPPK